MLLLRAMLRLVAVACVATWDHDGQGSVVLLLQRAMMGSVVLLQPGSCWCPWPVFPPKARWMPIVYAATWSHVNVHGPVSCWGSCWCPWSMLPWRPCLCPRLVLPPDCDGVHGLCCSRRHQRTSWGLWHMQRPEIMWMFMIHAVTRNHVKSIILLPAD